MNISIKFPPGMSERDKQIIFDLLRENIKGGSNEKEIITKIKTYIEEHLLLSVREL